MTSRKFQPFTGQLGFKSTIRQKKNESYLSHLRTKVEKENKLVISSSVPVLQDVENACYASCPRCNQRFIVLRECPLLEKTHENDDKLDSKGVYILDPDTECGKCCHSYEMSGWCIISDMAIGETNPATLARIKQDLKRYDDSIVKGKLVRKFLVVT